MRTHSESDRDRLMRGLKFAIPAGLILWALIIWTVATVLRLVFG